jgi:hypothetical protein
VFVWTDAILAVQSPLMAIFSQKQLNFTFYYQTDNPYYNLLSAKE